ncbi:MAG: flagellar biosynthesis anti-sigma factor FlgM [Pseudomonadota bacterium]
MRIDDKIANYEINQQLAKVTPNIKEGQPLPEGQKNSNIKTESKDAIVNLSQASKEVRLANEVISSTPDVREKKVLEIKEKIESGTYEINNTAVAAKLVDAFMDDIF